MVISLILGFAASFLVTFYVVPLLMQVARTWGILDAPDGKLKSHQHPTPYLGGVAVYVGFIVPLTFFVPCQNNLLMFLLGSTILLFVGLIDDLIILKPVQKLVGQIIATCCFLKAGCYLKELFFASLFTKAVSFFWILSVINAFNLVDVMDGLATTLALTATVGFIGCALYLDSPIIASMLSLFAGALAAFLYYNKPRAQLYLGDAGSLFIGGLLAAVPFMLPWGTYNVWGAVTPVIIVYVPLLELGTLILIRTYKKIPFYRGSADHFCLYLKANGWGVSSILGYSAVTSLLLAVLGVACVVNRVSLGLLAGIIGVFTLCWYAVLLLKKSKNP